MSKIVCDGMTRYHTKYHAFITSHSLPYYNKGVRIWFKIMSNQIRARNSYMQASFKEKQLNTVISRLSFHTFLYNKGLSQSMGLLHLEIGLA